MSNVYQDWAIAAAVGGISYAWVKFTIAAFKTIKDMIHPSLIEPVKCEICHNLYWNDECQIIDEKICDSCLLRDQLEK